jgi:hypothetical protein
VICGTALLFLCFSLSSSLLFSKKYKQNYRAFKIQYLPEIKKEYTKGTKQFSIVLREKLTGLAFVEFVVVATSFG